MKNKKNDTEEEITTEATEQSVSDADPIASNPANDSIDPKLLLHQLRDEIASIEAEAELIPTYYKTGGLKAKGHHSGNERARCFREATLLQLAYARGFLGKALGALGTPTPYPQSDNAESTVIEPPAYNKPKPELHRSEPVAAIKHVRATIGTALDHLKALLYGGYPWEPQIDHPLEFLAASKVALQKARFSLGEELGILGGH